MKNRNPILRCHPDTVKRIKGNIIDPGIRDNTGIVDLHPHIILELTESESLTIGFSQAEPDIIHAVNLQHIDIAFYIVQAKFRTIVLSNTDLCIQKNRSQKHYCEEIQFFHSRRINHYPFLRRS
ncbi:hypothetical protein ES703_81411 [subsurface metagenome]